MPIFYLLNYIELSYSEITFTYETFDSKISALSNFFQVDSIDELPKMTDVIKEKRLAESNDK